MFQKSNRWGAGTAYDTYSMARCLVMHIVCLSRIVMAHGIRGGMEQHLEAVATGLVQRGHQVTVLTTAHPRGLDHEIVAGVRYEYLDAPAGHYRPVWWRVSRCRLLEMMGTESIDVCWGQGAGAEGIACLPPIRRPPLVTILHGTLLGEAQSRLRNVPPIRNLVLAAILWRRAICWQSHVKAARAVVAVSNQVAEEAQEFYCRYPGPMPPMYVIPNGIQLEHFSWEGALREEMRQKLHIGHSEKLIIGVGRLIREKGFHILIEALGHLRCPDVRLALVGDGPDRRYLQKRIRSVHLVGRAQLIGYVPHTQVPHYLSAADIFVMPTLRHEGLPLSIIEAMASGLPIIAADIGGIPTAIEHDTTGLLFQSGDVEALAHAIKQVLSDARLAKSLGTNAQRFAREHFSQQRMLDRIEGVFCECALHANIVPRASS